MANGSNKGITLAQIRSGSKVFVQDDTTISGDIKAVQSALRMMGYWGSPNDPDGGYGSYSVAAVMGLQKENGLTANGTFDKAALAKVESFAGTLTVGHSTTPAITKISKGLDFAQLNDTGSAIQTISRYLKNHGYLTVEKTTFDSTMRTAVGNFQAAMGLTKDYTVGLATYVTLVNPNASNWFSGSKATLTAGMLARCGFQGLILLPAMVSKLNSAMSLYSVNTKEKVKHFLAQVRAETASGWSLVEATYKAGTGISGHTYSPYAGAGFLHLTWKDNYTAFYNYMKGKGTTDARITTPDTYATQHVAISYPGDSAGWYWMNRVASNVSWSGTTDAIGQKVTELIYGSSSQWGAARKAYYTKINGVLV